MRTDNTLAEKKGQQNKQWFTIHYTYIKLLCICLRIVLHLFLNIMCPYIPKVALYCYIMCPCITMVISTFFITDSFENIKMITCFRIKSVKQTFCFYRITKYIIHLLFCYNSIFIFIIHIKVTLIYYNNNFKMLPCLKIEKKKNSSFNTNCSVNKNMFYSL